MNNKKDFTSIDDHDSLAAFFGLSYSELAQIAYPRNVSRQYREFSIEKKNGDLRTIRSPSKKLKMLQKRLSGVLYEHYPGRPSAHGYCKGKSTITNANAHVNKSFVFSIDLLNFFESIHFGRIKRMFQSRPFCFNHSVAAILAQICCYKNSLPQGAPTSPILSNIILWKLDSQLQGLARRNRCAYSRYADDMVFSFTCLRENLPSDIVETSGAVVSAGSSLHEIIVKNGFKINLDKTRLASRHDCMSVTGIVVNEFLNVPRSFVRQTASMLHAWRKFGLERASSHFYEKYDTRHRATEKQKSYQHVIRGRLLYLKNVRSASAPIYTKLAGQFNSLADSSLQLVIPVKISELDRALCSIWVVECCYDDDSGEVAASQGTGFELAGGIFITCSHVVGWKGKIHDQIVVSKPGSVREFELEVLKNCAHRDIAICRRKGLQPSDLTLQVHTKTLCTGDATNLVGFPGYSPGQTPYVVGAKVARIYPRSAVSEFEVDVQIREGNSGGPILSPDFKVVGMALKGATKSSGMNGCITVHEITKYIAEEPALDAHAKQGDEAAT